MDIQAQNQQSRNAWNLGRIIGPKPPLKPKHIWALRTRLQHEGRTRDLAMFMRSTASCAGVISFAFVSPMSSSEAPFASEPRSFSRRRGGRCHSN